MHGFPTNEGTEHKRKFIKSSNNPLKKSKKEGSIETWMISLKPDQSQQSG
ncbi:MAG: hypothetical protein IPM26_06095 [Saprospiraceae bacterium]|nr:hypothetical protein [Saprospiraceae bacterium]